jgi:beta-lactamase class D
MKIKTLSVFFLGILVVSISGCKTGSSTATTNPSKQQVVPYFQELLDSIEARGSILIFDPQKNEYYSNDFKYASIGRRPASTFKIPNSIIALETGVLKNDSSILKWDGQKRLNAIWEKDLSLKEAFHVSCVPCYQEIARKVGYARMKEYLQKFGYGKMVFDTTTLDLFWLDGESTITQFEQINFLQRFYNSQLGIKNSTESIMKRLMIIEKNTEAQISGKTGWAIREKANYGWFVGYVERGDRQFYFATLLEPKEKFNMESFPLIRKKITYKALEKMGIW